MAKAATKMTARGKQTDATELLEADHRAVYADFAAFDEATTLTEKQQLAARICLSLRVHAQIEEEIFYPAARDATGETDLLDEALVEHMGAKSLVAQIEAMAPDQPLYDAKVKVLGEQVRHHVAEEEGELFPKVRESGLDLMAVGARLATRKAELMSLIAAMAEA
jgi:hemerythrin superfamily protein